MAQPSFKHKMNHRKSTPRPLSNHMHLFKLHTSPNKDDKEVMLAPGMIYYPAYDSKCMTALSPEEGQVLG